VATLADGLDGLSRVTSCGASAFSANGGGNVVVAASPEGAFVVVVAASSYALVSPATAPGPLPVLAHLQPSALVPATATRHHRRPSSRTGSNLARGNGHGRGPSTEEGAGPSDPAPNGEEVDSVAVSCGWGSGGAGVALAVATKDKLFYASSAGDPRASLAASAAAAAAAAAVSDTASATATAGLSAGYGARTSVGGGGGGGGGRGGRGGGDALEWRDEWVTTPDESGGSVDWRVARTGLAFEVNGQPAGEAGSAPRLWIGSGKGLQVLV